MATTAQIAEAHSNRSREMAGAVFQMLVRDSRPSGQVKCSPKHWQRYRVGPRADWHYERRPIIILPSASIAAVQGTQLE
jgi:hypothetical protein